MRKSDALGGRADTDPTLRREVKAGLAARADTAPVASVHPQRPADRTVTARAPRTKGENRRPRRTTSSTRAGSSSVERGESRGRPGSATPKQAAPSPGGRRRDGSRGRRSGESRGRETAAHPRAEPHGARRSRSNARESDAALAKFFPVRRSRLQPRVDSVGQPPTSGFEEGAAGWYVNPSAPDWLYKPGDAVFFHCPSQSLWQREAGAGFVRVDGAHLRSLRALASPVTVTTLQAFFHAWRRRTGDQKHEKNLLRPSEKACEWDTTESDLAEVAHEGPGILDCRVSKLPESLGQRGRPDGAGVSPPPRAGWRRAAAQGLGWSALKKQASGSWYGHPNTTDWLLSADHWVYCHLPSATLWQRRGADVVLLQGRPWPSGAWRTGRAALRVWRQLAAGTAVDVDAEVAEVVEALFGGRVGAAVLVRALCQLHRQVSTALLSRQKLGLEPQNQPEQETEFMLTHLAHALRRCLPRRVAGGSLACAESVAQAVAQGPCARAARGALEYAIGHFDLLFARYGMGSFSDGKAMGLRAAFVLRAVGDRCAELAGMPAQDTRSDSYAGLLGHQLPAEAVAVLRQLGPVAE
mmetsp:Transcript_42436/g.111811  ORF Transcript_42436/g.111811 Transcript_42436/m.111811 type:complete len:582 (+) Transcript_42436:122-1867(+)